VADDITVRGGAAGTGVALDHLSAAAERLVLEGARVGALAPQVLGATVDPAVLLAAVDDAGDLVDLLAGRMGGLDPAVLGLVAKIETGALRAGGPTGVLGVGLELGSLGVRLGVVVASYRVAEEAVRREVAALQDELMAVVGILTPGLVLVGGTAQLAGVDVPGALDRLAFEHPGVVDTAAGGIDGYLRGLARHPVFALVLAAGAARSRTPWPPADEEAAIRILGGVGGLAGALDEDRAWGSGGFGGLDVRLGRERESTGPAGLAGLMVDEADLGRDDDECRVRVVEVPQPDGSSAWILELPGTQAWDPRPGGNPFDLTTDVQAMAGEATMAAAGASGVLAAAQRRRGRLGLGDPVMLVGHSQGGILAASLASDPRFRSHQRVTDVVTFGAPVSRFPVPADVRVLSVEHRQDPVARLDGGRSPDRAGWVTVERDLSPTATQRSAALTHRATEYLRTAQLVDGRLANGTADPSLRDWQSDASPFFAGDARVTDAHLTRRPRPAR
jgi:hypothetical protein